ncbi:MAG: NPCBM/NEW2 domain-containing protein, partial [Pirellulaceae bacterium]
GIRRLLSDTPDPAAKSRLARLHAETRRCLNKPLLAMANSWRTLFEQASSLRDELLLERVNFDRMLLVKRKPYYSEQPFMDGHHCYNRPGGGIYCLSPVRPGGTLQPVVASLGLGIYRDVCLHWDAQRMLFSFGNGSDRTPRTTSNALTRPEGKSTYDLYEARVDGTELRPLTSSPKNDCEPFYVPNGSIGFTSDRSEHVVMCGSDIHGANLFTMDAAGSNVRQLSFNVFNEFNPTVLPDGRILYNRWEYNERSVTSLHDLFTIHPDGTHVAPYYGNATFRPNVIMFPRPVPSSNQVMALFTGHHGQTHGPLALIDVRHGVDGQDPITLLTPGVPIIGEKIEDSRRGWYSDPRPLSETTYLCSYTPTVLPWLENSWAIYIGDRHGNLALIYRDAEISCAEPNPLVARSVPRTLPDSVSEASEQQATASLMLVDVYEGLTGVPRGEAQYLRILEDVPRKSVPKGGVICTSGTQIYTIKRIIGTVPIEQDGSAYFTVPANRNLYFEVLDPQRREIQRMRSVVCLKPGEWNTCVGCHESRTQSPPSRRAHAFHRPPSEPEPAPWGDRTFSYLRDVQPVLNEACIRCHTHDRLANHVILTDDLTDQFCIGYEELLPYLSVANAMRWDHPDDVYARSPYTYGSNVSQLTRMLLQGHHDVSLTDEQWQRLSIWIDTNAVYYDRYETYTSNRHIFVGDVRAKLESAYARRCARCHGEKQDGRLGSWWMSIDRRDAGKSRGLLAPLAREAGGWQSCNDIVFADTKDADYQQMFAALTSLSETMANRPRADLLSIAGTPAEKQLVQLPPPPERFASAQGTVDADGTWDFLSDLPWNAARAGWTPNQDGLPRRNRDVTSNPIRLGARMFPKGLGTHAPSEIVYDLDGKYRRFKAVVGGAEANGTVVFQVVADDELVFDSGIMHGLRSVKTIDLPITNVQRLRLVVSDGGNDYFCDMANWANARVLRSASD